MTLTVQKTNASRRPCGPERDIPNLTAEPIRRPCPDVSMKRPEAGSTPACTTYAECDQDFRCVMRKPRKRQLLRSVDVAFVFWRRSVVDGVGAERSASALRRSGFSTIVGEEHTEVRTSRGQLLGYFFSA